jgi:NAD(P)-dependent dehydrogenase (short-subunit alcohol dehydrogenase family)
MTGRVVVITGGASGIGRATALAFARQGTRVIIGDIDLAGAEDTVASIKDKGGEADCLQVDVTKSTDVQAMVARAVAQYGGLDFALLIVSSPKVDPRPLISRAATDRAVSRVDR